MDFNYLYTSNPIDNEVFLELARHYKTKFFNDMKKLRIEDPVVTTHVTQCVPAVIESIGDMIEHHDAYISNNSVYFDTIKFHKQQLYVKVNPNRKDDITALSEEEGAPTSAENKNKEKKNDYDFILWTKSKAGEPVWQSPWGLGRPGWNTLCGVIAGTVSKKIFF